MRHNLGTVVGFEVRRTLTKRRYWISTLLVPVVMGIVFPLIFLSNSSTDSQVDAQKDSKLTFSYTDASGLVEPAAAALLGGTKTDDGAAAAAAVKASRLGAYVAYPAHPAKQTVRVVAKDAGIFENGKYSTIATRVLQLSAQQKIDSPELSALAQGHVDVEATTYKDGKQAGGYAALIPPLLFLVIFYVVILLLGNQMLTSTLEEKENRATEMILTAVNPTTLIIGKVISLFIIGIVQMLVFAIPGAIGYAALGSSLNLPGVDLSALQLDPGRMIVGALLLLGGFTLFTATLVAIGAIMPTAKDAGAFFGVMIALIFIPFYVVSLVVSDPHAAIVQVFTYFPYSTPVTAMLRNAFGSLSVTESIVTIVELFVIGGIVLRIAVELFRYGSIEYSKKVSIRGVLSRNRR